MDSLEGEGRVSQKVIEWRGGGGCLFSNQKVTSLMCGHVLKRHVSQKASDQVMGGSGVSYFSKPKEILHLI